MRLPEQPSGNGLAFSATGGRRESVSQPRIGELPPLDVSSLANGFPTVLAANTPPAPSQSPERRFETEPSRGGYRDGSRIGEPPPSRGPESSDRSAEDEDDYDESTKPASASLLAAIMATDPAVTDAKIDVNQTTSETGLAIGQEHPEGTQNPLGQPTDPDAESRSNPTADDKITAPQTTALNAKPDAASPANGITSPDAGPPGTGTPNSENAAAESSVKEQPGAEPTELAKSETGGRPVAGATTEEATGTDPSSMRSVDAQGTGETSGQQSRPEPSLGGAPNRTEQSAVATTGEMVAGAESSEPSTGRQRGRTGGPASQRDSRGRPGQVGDNRRGDTRADTRGEAGADRPAGTVIAAGMANGIAATGQVDGVSPAELNQPRASVVSTSSVLDAAIASGASPGSSIDGGGSVADAKFASESPSATAASGGDSAGQFGDRPAAESATMPSRTDIADRARLIHRIAKAFTKMGTDGGQIRMKMHPEDLGGVLLEMQVRGRTVEARVTVDSEAARGLLQQQLSELRQRLEGQGLTVEKLEIALRDDTNPDDPTGHDRGRHGFAGGDRGFGGQNGSAGADGFGFKRKGTPSGSDPRVAAAGMTTGLGYTRQTAARQPAAPGTLDLRL